MAAPRVFVSSTCYDLKYIRENLKYFIRTLGYEPVLSEEGNVFYNPTMHTHDACIAEVPNTQIFVLIIGGRFGGDFKGEKHSITNAEYKEAVRLGIPVFALVEQQVYSDHYVFGKNRKVDLTNFVFPSVDDIRIFQFIDDVRKNSINNAIVPFRDFADIESYLRQQWAGMMYAYLTTENESKRLSRTLTGLEEVNSRIELISKKILESVGTERSKVEVELYEIMIKSEPVRTLGFWGASPKPVSILVHASFRQCAKMNGIEIRVNEDDDTFTTGGDGSISRPQYVSISSKYKILRKSLVDHLATRGYTPETFLTEEVPIQPEADQGE